MVNIYLYQEMYTVIFSLHSVAGIVIIFINVLFMSENAYFIDSVITHIMTTHYVSFTVFVCRMLLIAI